MKEKIDLELFQTNLEIHEQLLKEELKNVIKAQDFERASNVKKILTSIQDLINTIDVTTNSIIKRKRKEIINQLFTKN